MSLALPFRLLASRKTRVVCVAIILATAAAAISKLNRKPRPWQVGEVPIAFWAWRNQTPSPADVRAATEAIKGRTIFLRAGQIDHQGGKLRRIRSVTGPLPGGVDLHLVYNATRALLSELENVEETGLAKIIATTFQEDVAGAAQSNVDVSGLQIDFDVPTRLLDRYERVLRAVRVDLRSGQQLSITGLPTWMESPKLRSTLKQVDFWIPQFYGAQIPERVDELIPISSTLAVERFVNQARETQKPFYAGLAAYSCALLYSASGSLITLRGDIDPGFVAANANLELIDRQEFGAAAGEWRYAYRARAGGVIDNLAMQAGDVLVLDVPSAESLRATARIVRRLAGENLLGICVFRLPASDDPATLTVKEVAAALADQDSIPAFTMNLKRNEKRPQAWFFEIENHGSAGAIGLKVDVPVDPGTIESVSVQRGAALETICHGFDPANRPVYQTCGQNRANVIRFTTPGLRPGQTLRALLHFKTAVPPVLPVSIETQTVTGRPYFDRIEVATEGGITR
jgi:hypothetical protein